MFYSKVGGGVAAAPVHAPEPSQRRAFFGGSTVVGEGAPTEKTKMLPPAPVVKQQTVYGFGEHGFNARHKASEERKDTTPFCCPSSSDRKKVLPEYDTENAGMFKILFAWRGTVLPLVLRLPFFWLVVLTHVTLVMIKQYTDTQLIADVESSIIAIPASLLIFFVVFYAGQCYNRFFDMYAHTVAIGGTTMLWIGMIKLHLPDDYSAQWNATRFILASTHVLYYGLDGGMSDKDWETVHARRLLSNEEIRMVSRYNGYLPFLLIYWALREVQHELKQGDAETDRWRAHAYQQFEQLGFTLRGTSSQITNLLKQPVPWAYYHLLNFMTVLVLVLLAYGFVGMAPPFASIVAFIVISLMVLGLKELAVAMADPFGDDVIDFQLEKFLAGSYRNALAHLGDTYQPTASKVEEEVAPPKAVGVAADPDATMEKQTSLCEVTVKSAEARFQND